MAEWRLVRFKDEQHDQIRFYRARLSRTRDRRWEVYGVVDCTYAADELLDYGEYVSERDADLVIWIDDDLPTIDQIAAMIEPQKAQLAVANVMVALGADTSWSGDTVMAVKEAVQYAFPKNLPDPTESEADGTERFWQTVGGYETDDSTL